MSRPNTPSGAYERNLQTWSSNPSATPAGATASQRAVRSRKSAANVNAQSNTASSRSPAPSRLQSQQPVPVPAPQPIVQNVVPPPQPPAPLAPKPLPHGGKQAYSSTYASRLRTGATLLMQPILLAPPDAPAPGTRSERASERAAAAASSSHAAPERPAAPSRSSTRRGGASTVNYTEPDSDGADFDEDDKDEDDKPDKAAANDGEFQASGGVRTAVRRGRLNALGLGPGQSIIKANTPTTPGGQKGGTATPAVGVLEKSYLGLIPPQHFAVPRPFPATKHEYFSEDQLLEESHRPTSLVPVRVEFETDTHRIRDVFTWNIHERLLSPEHFARVFAQDLDLDVSARQGAVETMAAQIRAQLEDVEGIASMDLSPDWSWVDERQPSPGDKDLDLDLPVPNEPGEETPECRVIVEIDVQVGLYHVQDHIEWDLLSPLTPEVFARQLCADIGLAGEACPLIAHAVHEELLRHKRDAVEWGVLGAEAPGPGSLDNDHTLSVLKDRTGLGLGWGKAPKDGRGRGPKTLRSVWRDWQEAEEFATRFEVLSQEEVERREMERERATRRLRRETSKFQSQGRARRR